MAMTVAHLEIALRNGPRRSIRDPYWTFPPYQVWQTPSHLLFKASVLGGCPTLLLAWLF